MKRGFILALAFAASIPLVAQAKDKPKSGCKTGEGLVPFQVKAITGADKGKTLCYI